MLGGVPYLVAQVLAGTRFRRASHKEYLQILNHLCQGRPFDRNIPSEGFPLKNFGRVLRKGRGQSVRQLDRDFRVSPRKGRRDCPCKSVAGEVVGMKS